MTRLTLFVLLLLSPAGSLWAQKAGDFGAGVAVGRPIGGTAKLWLDGIHAIDGGIGWGDDLTFHTDFVWHGWKAFAQPKEGKLALQLSLGLRAEVEDHETDVAIRTLGGVTYWLKQHPIELFAEVGPVFQVNNGGGVGVDGGLGLRYYFQGFN